MKTTLSALLFCIALSQAALVRLDSVTVDSVWVSDSGPRMSRDCIVGFRPVGTDSVNLSTLVFSLDGGSTWSFTSDSLFVLDADLSRKFTCNAKSSVRVRVLGGDRPNVAFKATVRQLFNVPEWFASMPVMRWEPLAGGAGFNVSPGQEWRNGTRFDQAEHEPGILNTELAYYFRGWNGGCVNQQDKEFIMAGNGGHAAQFYNDAFALALGTDVPTWTQLCRPTPGARISSGGPGSLSYQAVAASSPATNRIDAFDANGDGPGGWPTPFPPAGTVNCRPRTMHTCAIQVYSEGRVWFPYQNAYDIGSGNSRLAKWSFQREALKYHPEWVPWRYGEIAPWSYDGYITEITDNQSALGFGASALDPVTGRIWYVPDGASSFWCMETHGANAGTHTAFRHGATFNLYGSFGASLAHDLTDTEGKPLKLLVAYVRGTNDILVVNVTPLDVMVDATYPRNPVSASAGVLTAPGWTATPTNGSDFRWAAASFGPRDSVGVPQAWGMVYHAPSKAFLAFNTDQSVDTAGVTRTGAVRKLKIPLTEGRYNKANPGNWIWSEIPMGSDLPPVCNPGGLGGGGSYNRFNLVTDFDGQGNGLLISASQYDKPVYVAKIPNTEVGP